MTFPELPFSIEAEAEIGPGRYSPVPLDPSGLRMAWLLSVVTSLVCVYLLQRNLTPPPFIWLTSGFLILLALSISFSHWLERRTVVILEPEAIRYESPLRKITIPWDAIEELWCESIRGGWRFIVSGSGAVLRFQSLVVLRSGMGREVRTGYVEGKQIARVVHKHAELQGLERKDQIWIYRKLEGQV